MRVFFIRRFNIKVMFAPTWFFRLINTWIGISLLACSASKPQSKPHSSDPLAVRAIDEKEAIGENIVNTHTLDEVDATTPLPDLVIGWQERLVVKKAAKKLNREGLKLHKNGDYEASRSKFSEALEIEPDYDLARFNLACALSRLDRHDEAIPLLTHAVTRDPHGILHRIRRDSDLMTLRESEQWQEIEDYLERVELALEQAYAKGVSSMFYDYSKPIADWQTPQRGGTTNLVLGLYLHGTKRFVPLAKGGETGYLDLSRKRLARVDSKVWEGVSHTMWRRSSITLSNLDPEDNFAVGIDFKKDGPGAVGHPDLLESCDNLGFEVSAIMVSTDEGLWMDLEWNRGDRNLRNNIELTLAGLNRTQDEIPEIGTRIELTYEGAVFYDPPPPGHRVDGRDYFTPTNDTPFKLNKRHRFARWQSVAQTPDKQYAIISSIEQREGPDFEESGFGILRHIVDRLDLLTGEAVTMVQGKGTARCTVALDGSIYIQSKDKVYRWQSADAKEPESVMKGLMLVTQLEPLECLLC